MLIIFRNMLMMYTEQYSSVPALCRLFHWGLAVACCEKKGRPCFSSTLSLLWVGQRDYPIIVIKMTFIRSHVALKLCEPLSSGCCVKFNAPRRGCNGGIDFSTPGLTWAARIVSCAIYFD